MITREEADQIAEKWVSESAPGETPTNAVVHEFDLGYVVWAEQAPGEPPMIGANRGIIDKDTGELSIWPSLPVDMVITQFRERRRTHPPTLKTWDPADQARWDLRHVPTPTNISHLRLPDSLVIARSVKGDREPRHHLLVLAFLRTGLAPQHRERGHDRCSEAAALSDALHAEDARRHAAGQPLITLEEARTGLFAGAGLVTYRVREPGDPVAGETALPCLSCAMLLRHFGFEIRPPDLSGLIGRSGSEGGVGDG
jgi:hypothetical protein